MAYTIEVYYQTGDSFGSEMTNDTIGPVWKDKNLAYKALEEIMEFNDFYSVYSGWGISESRRKKVIELAKKRPWYIESEYDFGFPSTMTMLMDDGSRMSCYMHFITGYFEHLESAKVIEYHEEEPDQPLYAINNRDLDYLIKKYDHDN